MIAYQYYQCDAWKTWASMTPRNLAYKDTKTGRRALADAVLRDYENENIRSDDIQLVYKKIMSGDMAGANELIEYGYIHEIEVI